MKNGLYLMCFLAGVAGMLQSCGGSGGAQHPEVNINYESFPFYRDFAALDTDNLQAGLERLHQKYPYFLDFYLDTLAGLDINGQYSDTLPVLRNFLTYKDYRALFDTVNSVFPDTRDIDAKLKASFQNIKYYDSLIRLPEKVYYFVSGLNFYTAVLHNDSILGIGLDMFLGRDFAPYASVGIPAYATIRFTKENIPVWACRIIYQNRFPFVGENKTLLEMMVERGKEIYFLDKVLPAVPLHLKLGYTKAQLQWCQENEVWIYNFFIKNKLLYETNHQKVMRYVLDGPETPGFPKEAPGNLGSYIGYRIIRKYAAEHQEPMDELFSNQNAQQILAGAKYKP